MGVPRKDKIYVLLQFLVFFAWLWETDHLRFQLSENLQNLALIIAGIGLVLSITALLQVGTGISPFPSPRRGTKLVTTGAFAFARHPIYSGILFMVFGISIWWGSGYKLIIGVVLFLLFFLKSRYEEKRLLEAFPEYEEYRKNTGRFFPKFEGRI